MKYLKTLHLQIQAFIYFYAIQSFAYKNNTIELLKVIKEQFQINI